MSRLERFGRYPTAACARRQEGIAQLRTSVARDGSPLHLSLEHSSGVALLDQARSTPSAAPPRFPRCPTTDRRRWNCRSRSRSSCADARPYSARVASCCAWVI